MTRKRISPLITPKVVASYVSDPALGFPNTDLVTHTLYYCNGRVSYYMYKVELHLSMFHLVIISEIYQYQQVKNINKIRHIVSGRCINLEYLFPSYC